MALVPLTEEAAAAPLEDRAIAEMSQAARAPTQSTTSAPEPLPTEARVGPGPS
jgi:hypothetical protein